MNALRAGCGRFYKEKRMNRDITYIVTGCTGYVGNVLTKKLLAEGCRVRGFARSREKFAKVFEDAAPEVVFGDIADAGDVEKLFEGDAPFAVVHTVAKVSIGEGSTDELNSATVTGTRNVVEACLRHGAKKLLHISSTEAFPRGYFPDENLTDYVPDPAKARTAYAKSKSEADRIVLNAVKEHGLDASILMLAGVLGPGDYSNSHMTQMFIEFIEDRLPASVNAGYNDFDIRDFADVLPAVFERAKRGESYIFAHQPDKINDCLNVICGMTGRKMIPTLPLWVAYVGLPFLYIASKLSGKRPLYTGAALSSIRERSDFPIGKSVREFGYSPRPLEETVRDHINFLAEHGMVRI